jgi:hypothetical protein
MKVQFSLATLLVCVTVLAGVCAVATFVPTREAIKPNAPALTGYYKGNPVHETFSTIGASSRPPFSRRPTAWDIGLRAILWGPLAVAAAAAVLLILRRLSLRSAVFVIVPISIPLIWFACQLNWIRQRHAFLSLNVLGCQFPDRSEDDRRPWSLRLLGEQSILAFTVYADADVESAKYLFPESLIFGPTSPKIDTRPNSQHPFGSRSN